MADYVVRNEIGAWAALTTRGDISSLRFEGWPRLVVQLSERVDGVRSALAVCAAQEAVERQYCLLKYGTRDLRHLTRRDKADVHLDVHPQPDPRRLVIDFSRAANAAVGVVSAWGSDGPRRRQERTRSLFDDPHLPESWARTARELGLKFIDKARARDIRQWGFATILVVGIAVAGALVWKETLGHAFDMQRMANEHQLKLAELETTTIVRRDGEMGAVTKSSQRALEQDLSWDSRRAKMLVSAEIGDPLLKFVVSEADYARPAILDMAPEGGTIDINGLALPAETARAGAKALMQLRRAARGATGDGGWKTIVQPGPKPIRS